MFTAKISKEIRDSKQGRVRSPGVRVPGRDRWVLQSPLTMAPEVSLKSYNETHSKSTSIPKIAPRRTRSEGNKALASRRRATKDKNERIINKFVPKMIKRVLGRSLDLKVTPAVARMATRRTCEKRP